MSITWLGFYINTFPMAATTATYAIDGQAPITFNLNGASSQSTGVQYNQIFFQTDQLPAGSHKLNVVYQGNFNTTPLSFSKWRIKFVNYPHFVLGFHYFIFPCFTFHRPGFCQRIERSTQFKQDWGRCW